MKMDVYYIAYNYGGESEYIEGPFGTWIEAFDARREFLGTETDENLIIVKERKEVEVCT